MNTMSNVQEAIPANVAAWCSDYSDFALGLAQWFLYLAFFVALVETALLLWGKIKALLKQPEAADPNKAERLAVAGVDPVKLLEALKALLETLKGLPAWVAIFLAGLALLWIAGEKPKACAPPPAPCQAAKNCPPERPAPGPGATSNTQAASNTQAPSNTQ